jgi:predicted nucleotide-binding protein
VPKIFLIDDDYATEILAEQLQFRGFVAQRISSFTGALQSIKEVAAADLVILDIIMESPRADSTISGDRTTGMALFKALRDKNQNVPILVFSATTDKELIDAINQTPRSQFLSKWNTPSLKEFLKTVERIVGSSTEKTRPRSFIVHGHDTVEKLALKNYLQNSLGFPEPVILHEQPSLGRTIIEKLETYAPLVDLAFVLLTPDDVMASEQDDTNDKKRHARQNVIFELGYFLGVFGRLSGRVFLLHKAQLDLPSDLSGVIYIDISNGVEAAGEIIRKELDNVI